MTDDLTEHCLSLWETYCREAHRRFVEQGRLRAAPASIAADAPWWIAAANTNHERRARQGLAALGYEVWYPEVVREIRVGPSRLKASRKFPAVAGLLLCRHANPNAWSGMIGVDGVRDVLNFDHIPCLVPAAEVERWRAEMAVRAVPVVEDVLKVGDKLIITDGPFASFPAVVERLTGLDRLRVQAMIFGRLTGIDMERGQVARKLDAAAGPANRERAVAG